MKKILEKYPLFLLLLPAFVVIHLEKELHELISYEFVYDRVIILFAVPFIILGIWYLFFRTIPIASLMTFGCLLPFYYTGDLKNWLSDKLPHSFLQSYFFLLSVFVVMLLALFFILRKKRTVTGKLFLFINTAMLLFIAVDVVAIFFTDSKNKYTVVGKNELSYHECDSCHKPDIYYIIFDAYASSKQLKDEYGYSNQPIEDYLHNKGFYIAKDSKSNYNYTAFSIGSTLNMSYIKNIDTLNKTTNRQYLQALKLVYNGRIFSFLEKEGYRIFNHSLFNIRHHSTTVNSFDNWGYREMFDQYNLFFKIKQDIEPSLPKWAQHLFGKNKYFINDPANRIKLDSLVLQQLEETARANTPEPKFVYAHFLRAHPPYASDSSGNRFVIKSGTIEEAYIHQVAWCNTTIKSVTDTIIANAKKPLVIIIQGDHGISFDGPVNKKNYFLNFSAIYFSNKDYSLLTDSTHNVNTFRIIFNTFFDQDMKLLPYRSEFIRWW